MGTVTQQLGGFEKTSKRVGNVVKTLFAGVAVGAAVNGIKDVVSSASDAQQSLGATQTVFGKYADSVIENSKRASTAIGLSANEYRELSNVTGALLNGAGVPMKRLGGLTDDINKRAADMAATFGGTTREAVEAISSLMKGEADPIEKYGVSIKQSDINARLAAQGLDDLTGSALKQAEMQARLDMLMQKTSKTQGAFQKESNTLAHQQQVLGAQWENLKATLGTHLLPIITKVLTVVNKSFVPAFEAAAAFVKPLIARVKEFFSAGSSGTSALQPLIDFIRGQVVPAFMGIVSALQGLWATIQPIIMQVVTAIMSQWSTIQPYVSQTFNAVKSVIVNVMGIIQQVITIAANVITKVWDVMGGTILKFVTKTFSNVAQFIGGIMKAIAGVVKVVLSVLKGDWKGAWNGIKQIVSGVWQAIKALVKQAVNIVKSTISGAWNAVKALTSAAWDAVKAAVVAGVTKTVGVVKTIKGKVLGALRGAGTWLSQIGRDIIQGLVNGLDSAKDWVVDKIQAITDKIPGWVKKRLGIASPSKVMKRLGRFISQGLARGIEQGSKRVDKAMAKTTKMLTNHYKKRGMSASKAGKKAAQITNRESKAVYRNIKAHGKLSKRLEDARKNLEDLTKAREDYYNSIRDQYVGYGNITGLDAAFNANSMIANLSKRIAKTKQYVALLQNLRAMGLNETMYQQLVAAGVEGGLATANAIAEGGPAAVAAFNSLQAELNTAAGTLANDAASQMHDAGIAAAQGLVNGLEASIGRLERVIEKMSKKMIKRLRKVLGIKSPSRVFRQLGKYTVEGMEIGLADTSGVQRKVINLSQAMTKSFDPQLTTATRATAPQAGKVTINVNVPPTADKAAVGREVHKTLEAYYAKGGRRSA